MTGKKLSEQPDKGNEAKTETFKSIGELARKLVQEARK